MILSYTLSSCMVDTGLSLKNRTKTSYDVNEYITVSILDTMRDVHITFGLNVFYNEEDIQSESSDLSYEKLKYHFSIPYPILPIVKLNSFSFTNKNGDTIPSILYYRTIGRRVHIVDSLPVIFNDDIKRKEEMIVPLIWVECSQSYASIKTVYINYDIEVGDKRFVKQSKYTKKRYWDWRPKL